MVVITSGANRQLSPRRCQVSVQEAILINSHRRFFHQWQGWCRYGWCHIRLLTRNQPGTYTADIISGNPSSAKPQICCNKYPYTLWLPYPASAKIFVPTNLLTGKWRASTSGIKTALPSMVLALLLLTLFSNTTRCLRSRYYWYGDCKGRASIEAVVTTGTITFRLYYPSVRGGPEDLLLQLSPAAHRYKDGAVGNRLTRVPTPLQHPGT